MKCQEVEILLTESLSQAHLAEVREHLADCQQCRRLWQELEAIEGLQFSLVKMAGAPDDFSRRVVVQLHRRRFRRTSWTVAATLAFLAFGLSGLLVLQKSNEPGTGIASRERQLPRPIIGMENQMILADPIFSVDPGEQYLEVILGEPLRPSSLTRGVPSEIMIHRTDMGKVNLTHVSH